MAWFIIDPSIPIPGGGITSDDIANNSSVTGANVTEALNELLTQQNILRQRLHFVAGSIDNITVNTDPNAPSFLTNLALDPGSFGASLDFLDGSVKNVSGRAIPQMVGTISFQPNKGGGGVTLLHLWSERSNDDGTTWTQNSNSLRAIEISNSGETFKTSLSAILNWAPDELIRFRIYALSGGSITFVSPTDTVLGGEVINGYSVAWELSEN